MKIEKVDIAVHNLVMGTTYLELEGKMTGYNERNGDTINLKFNPRGWNREAQIEGTCCDKDGKKWFDITGNTFNEIMIKHCNGEEMSLYKSFEMGEECKREYYFT